MATGNPGLVQGAATALSQGDLLSNDSVLLPVFDADLLPAPAVAETNGGVLQVSDLLDTGSAGLSGEGGFLVFDHQSIPGSTIVRVMLEGADHHQLFDIGTLPGGVPNLNSLLGLIMPDPGQG